MVLATLKSLRRGHIPCRFCRALAQTIHVHHDTVCWYFSEAAPLWRTVASVQSPTFCIGPVPASPGLLMVDQMLPLQTPTQERNYQQGIGGPPNVCCSGGVADYSWCYLFSVNKLLPTDARLSSLADRSPVPALPETRGLLHTKSLQPRS